MSVLFLLGYDIATGIFGDPALGARGNTLTGPGSLGIRVMAIAPSLFLTGMTAGFPEEVHAALLRDAAFPKRMGRPNEYAKLVTAIIENPMLNGLCIRLDAGQRLAPQ